MKKDIGRTVKYLDWKGKIACQDVDKHLRLDTSQISTSANCFMFILVESGGCEFNFIRRRMSLTAGEVMVFPPTYPPCEIVASNDYKALGLIVQRDYAYTHTSVLGIYQSFMSTVVLEQTPKAKPSKVQFKILTDTVSLIRRHMMNPHQLTDDVISSLYSVFLYDLTACIRTHKEDTAQRPRKIYIQFLEILNANFREHHDIPFYASALNISPRYLAMITKRLTGDTVLHYINERLVLEACWLLKSTGKSMQEISEELHFSDQAAFSKFFKRQRGKKPLQYRREQEE